MNQPIEFYEKFGRTFAKWDNYTHPDNPDFMQPVYWYADFNPENKRMKIGYALQPAEPIKKWQFVDCISVEQFKDILKAYLIRVELHED